MLSGIAFAHPWVLAALVILPLVWWLLRLIPPAPAKVRFPPIRLLFDLTGREETPVRAPPWLIALRLLLATLAIIALADPVYNRSAALEGDGPLLLIIDDGWTAAARWPDRLEAMDREIDRAERERRPVMLLTTAPAAGQTSGRDLQTVPAAMSAVQARGAARAIAPKPWPVDRALALERLNRAAPNASGHVIWLSDGIDSEGARRFANRLRAFDSFELVRSRGDNLAPALLPLDRTVTDPVITAVRAATPRPGILWIRATTADGRLIARNKVEFGANAARASARLGLPLALRNQIARIEIEDRASAGAVMLADDRWRRQPVGLVSGQAIEAAQPLLSDLYYLRKALEPVAELREGSISDLIASGVAVLALADVGGLLDPDRSALAAWIDRGGVLLRFAGPKLAERVNPDFLPVSLRTGGRAMGGAMSWAQPARLAPFDTNSPFSGLELPDDIVVNRQVLAEPGPGVSGRTWARLEDGTPLVTGARRQNGWLILFHVTANADWSNLPLSGLFVAMLERTVGLVQRQGAASREAATLHPLLLMDGFGTLGQPDPAIGALRLGGEEAPARADASHPPGYYGPESGPLALNLMSRAGPIDARFTIEPLAPMSGVSERLYGAEGEVSLGPSVLVIVFLIALVDFAVGLALRGLLRPAIQAAAGSLLLAAALAPLHQVMAQGPDGAEQDAALSVRLGYVETGDRRIDSISRSGLQRLGEVLARRTTISPEAPAGVNLETDELVFFPLIYWPLTGDDQPLSAAAQVNLDRYLKTGGILIVDTRGVTPATQALRKALGRLDIPPLVRLPKDHVLTKTFYLLNQYPAFRATPEIWVERHAGGVNDGVSALIIVSGDWAGTWALGEFTRSRPEQREAAFRFGVNLVMYALTGNYKADQVHVPALLERLGQ